jgi:hypothetical protein
MTSFNTEITTDQSDTAYVRVDKRARLREDSADCYGGLSCVNSIGATCWQTRQGLLVRFLRRGGLWPSLRL